jgi:hypothetical protein
LKRRALWLSATRGGQAILWRATECAWYFYGLHGNLVKSGQMERVFEAVRDGLIGLPEHDYEVLRRWHEAPYGF